MPTLAELNPCLCGLLGFITNGSQNRSHENRFFCIEYLQEHNQQRYLEGNTLYDIVSAINADSQSYGSEVLGRVLFIEDIQPGAIEYLGSAFDIDPLFFATYIDTSFSSLVKHPAPPSLAIIPSRFTVKNALHLHYQRILDLGKSGTISKESLRADSNVVRSIKRLPPLGGVNIALTRSCCSILRKHFDGKPWLCKCVLLHL